MKVRKIMFSKIAFLSTNLLLLLFTVRAFSQEPYSQSMIYEPRQFSDHTSTRREKGTNFVAPAVRRETVTIPVSLLDANAKPVLGLDKQAFIVVVEGKKVAVTGAEKLKGPLNVLFLVESSTGTRSAFKDRRAIVSSIVERLEPQDRVSIIKFDQRPSVLCDLTTDRVEIDNAIKRVAPRDGTSLYNTVRFVFEERLPTIVGPTVVFLLTDGVDTTSDSETFSSSLEWAEKSDAVIMPIYLDTLTQNLRDPGSAQGRWVNGGISTAIASEVLDDTRKRNTRLRDAHELGKLYLSDLAIVSGGRASLAKSFKDAAARTSAELLEGIRQSYRVTFKPLGPDTLGARKRILVRVDVPGLSVMAPGSYIVR
jgi:VWFA-related protein